MNRTTRWGLPAVAALAGPMLTPAVPAVAEPPIEHCYTTALSMEEIDAGAVSEVHCDDEPLAARQAGATLAVHYKGTGGSGTSLTVSGATCTDAGISFQVTDSWNNAIKSTRLQACGNAKHFVNNDYSGDHELVTGSAGSIHTLSTTMGNHVSSVGYDG